MSVPDGGVLMALEAMVQQIREAGAQAVAVVSRDGSVLAADLPPNVSRETFSIMCATIHGASMTVSNEIRRGAPKRITLDSPNGSVVIMEAGRRALVVVVLPEGSSPNDVNTWLPPLVERIARETS